MAKDLQGALSSSGTCMRRWRSRFLARRAHRLSNESYSGTMTVGSISLARIQSSSAFPISPSSFHASPRFTW